MLRVGVITLSDFKKPNSKSAPATSHNEKSATIKGTPNPFFSAPSHAWPFNHNENLYRRKTSDTNARNAALAALAAGLASFLGIVG